MLRWPSTALPSPAQPYFSSCLLEDRCTLQWGHISRTAWEATDPRPRSTALKVRHGSFSGGGGGNRVQGMGKASVGGNVLSLEKAL